MEKSKRKTSIPKPNVWLSIATYGKFIYDTLKYFGVKGTDIIGWLETLHTKLPDILHAIQGLL